MDAATTKFFYDSADAIADYDAWSERVEGADDVLLATYVTPGLDRNLLTTRNGSTYYYMSDGLGSIRTVTDSNETTQNTYDYYAFGKELGSWTEGVANRYTYTAREYDTESAQYYYRARHYDGGGRFLSKDPARDGLNSYVYVRSRPAMLTDSRGLYGSSIHYSLTRDMLKRLGFSKELAGQIASENNGVDTEHDPRAIGARALLLANQYAAASQAGDVVSMKALEKAVMETEEEMMRWHFPQIPNENGLGSVEQGSLIARDRVRDAIRACNSCAFGRELHVFQDSYSHWGLEGQLPLGFFYKNSYGHWWPDGDWTSTAADDPFGRPDLAQKMAKESYLLMTEFRTNCAKYMTGAFAVGPPPPWNATPFMKYWEPTIGAAPSR